MDGETRHFDEEAFYAEAIAAFAAGDERAADALGRALADPLRREVRQFLGDDAGDVDDVVQESIIAVLHYLGHRGEFRGNLVKFAVTVARNRCRNLLNWRKRRPHVPLEPIMSWLENPERSPLDLLLDQEVGDILQDALSSLPEDCQFILRAFYLEDMPVERIRRRIGLTTVQGIYYRKAACLEQAFRRLNRRLGICSSERDGERER